MDGCQHVHKRVDTPRQGPEKCEKCEDGEKCLPDPFLIPFRLTKVTKSDHFPRNFLFCGSVRKVAICGRVLGGFGRFERFWRVFGEEKSKRGVQTLGFLASLLAEMAKRGHLVVLSILAILRGSCKT